MRQQRRASLQGAAKTDLQVEETSRRPWAVGFPQQGAGWSRQRGAEVSHLFQAYCESMGTEQEKPSLKGSLHGD